MTIYRLDRRIIFPSPYEAEPDGLLAVGGDLSPARLELAYRSGIFPWYTEGSPILWFSPEPRMILMSSTLRINRSLRKAIRKRPYTITLDQAFSRVMKACAQTPRPGQNGTWITQDMLRAYEEMHRLGLAHSVEAWEGDQLVGGAYGICLGGLFCGESMFAHAPNASKISFSALIHQMYRWDIRLIDCQVYTEHLDSLGGFEVPRYVFLQKLQQALHKPTRKGAWELDDDLLYGPTTWELD
ncbi:MAG: leucyl/phenylalanyl-tRNA--protein transferase [Deltaproteobacteria bacterium]|nr:MAG: leucyl/phenylalanyl-tRNA--protein transferase [Deltaproteobacteria bacterium]